MLKNHPKIVSIGGGTGNFTLLGGLKRLTPNVTAIVNMSDDGGSTGTLRDELGVLPPGDIRQCLVALSDSPDMRDVFNYRFGKGAFANHSLGNVILSGLELKYGSFDKAVKVAESILRITGRVVPVTLDNHTLLLYDGDEVVRGEDVIAHYTIHSQDTVRIGFDPVARLNPEAAKALHEADLIVIAPGNLHRSLLPALAVEGMAEALAAAPARKVMVSNLVNKPGQTDGWHVVDYAKTIERCIGIMPDYVLYNDTPPPKDLLTKYAEDGELPVDTRPERFKEIKTRAIGIPLVDLKPYVQDPNDTIIRRTLIRHDAERVCSELAKLLRS